MHVHYNFLYISLPPAKQLAMTKFCVKAMLQEAIFFPATCNATNVALQVAKTVARVTPHFRNLQCNKMLRCKLQEVELSSTFRNVARQVAACSMSSVTCNLFFVRYLFVASGLYMDITFLNQVVICNALDINVCFDYTANEQF